MLLVPLSAGVRLAWSSDDPSFVEQKIRLIVETFSERLGISERVIVSIVPGNPRLISVERDGDAFRFSFEEAFLRTLDEGELQAAIAHELGHIWIYNHFPYLHTESLANDQALKLVRREDLQRVYEKVWKWKGRKGDLAKVLDPETDLEDFVKR
jgi:hypothetical protein